MGTVSIVCLKKHLKKKEGNTPKHKLEVAGRSEQGTFSVKQRRISSMSHSCCKAGNFPFVHVKISCWAESQSLNKQEEGSVKFFLFDE